MLTTTKYIWEITYLLPDLLFSLRKLSQEWGKLETQELHNCSQALRWYLNNLEFFFLFLLDEINLFDLWKKNQQRNDPCGGTAIKTIAESKLEKNSCLGKVWTHVPGSEASFGGFSWFKESDQITLSERQTL